MAEFSATDLTICIPAYNAAAFIGRTIGCAQAQTYPHFRMLISVDRSDDDTAAICRAHAAADRRIEVFEQSDRLGWAMDENGDPTTDAAAAKKGAIAPFGGPKG